MAAVVLLLLFIALILIYLLLTRQWTKSPSKRLPPGSMGLPIIGQSLSLLRAMRANTAEKWIERRINKYGPVSKLSLFGTPTIFLNGPVANKFIFANESLALQQPRTITRILGDRNMMELIGDDHKRVRGAVGQFLRPEVLKRYVGKMDEEVQHHLRMNWFGQEYVTVLPLMKRLTFDIICSLLFGLERGARRHALVSDFTNMVEGMWAVPVNLPFTRFNKSLNARKRARKVIAGIMEERKASVENGGCDTHGDLITYLLSLSRGEDKENGLTEEEIIDNSILVMVAGHDTSSILLTFIVRHLANDPDTYAAVCNEQEGIAEGKPPGEALASDDLLKMKYTWRVAMETLRMIPPVFGNFRKALKDLEFDGYHIPKGWQVFWASCLTQMDANIFSDPSRFDPSRFDSQNQSSIPSYCFVAFGGGPRICPGNEFAKIETLVALHYLVTQFKWKLICKDDIFCRDPLPSPAKGLPIQLEPKE